MSVFHGHAGIDWPKDCPICREIDRTIRAEAERDALRADLARISAELGLPPTIGPADGWLRGQMEALRTLTAECDQLRARVAALEPDALKYRAWMEVRERAGWKDGQPCACVWAWEGDELLHECEAHRARCEATCGLPTPFFKRFEP